MPAQDNPDILQRIRAEIASVGPFKNWHGITSENLARYLVEPYLVNVSHGGILVPMWVVLHEKPADPGKGYLIAFYPECNQWCLVEKQDEGYECDVEGDSTLAWALSNM